MYALSWLIHKPWDSGVPLNNPTYSVIVHTPLDTLKCGTTEHLYVNISLTTANLPPGESIDRTSTEGDCGGI